tara:strand:- start:45 stop:209 length:165 start_codon:yes stop_codon:yes gene_type:complete
MFKLLLICFIASVLWGVLTHRDDCEVKYGKDMSRTSQSDAEAMIMKAMWMNLDE